MRNARGRERTWVDVAHNTADERSFAARMAETAKTSDRYRGSRAGPEKVLRPVAGLAFEITYIRPEPVAGQPSHTTRLLREASATPRTGLDGHPRPRPPKYNPAKRGVGVASRSLRLRGHLTGSSVFLWPFVPALLAWGLVAVAATSELPSIDAMASPKQGSATLSPSIRMLGEGGAMSARTIVYRSDKAEEGGSIPGSAGTPWM